VRHTDLLLAPQVMLLQKSLHEPLLKEDLECWRCCETFKTLPKLKEHLEQEKDAEASHEKGTHKEKKKKTPEDRGANEVNHDREEPSSKRQAITPGIGT